MRGTWCSAAQRTRESRPRFGNHSFRAIGITDYMENDDEVSFSEIERVGI
jgi:hypothetical protein